MRAYSAAVARLIAAPRSSAARARAGSEHLPGCAQRLPAGGAHSAGASGQPLVPQERGIRGPHRDGLGGAPGRGAQVPAAVQAVEQPRDRTPVRTAIWSASRRCAAASSARPARRSRIAIRGQQGRQVPQVARVPGPRPAPPRRPARRRPGRRPRSAPSSGAGCSPAQRGRGCRPGSAAACRASRTAPSRSPACQAATAEAGQGQHLAGRVADLAGQGQRRGGHRSAASATRPMFSSVTDRPPRRVGQRPGRPRRSASASRTAVKWPSAPARSAENSRPPGRARTARRTTRRCPARRARRPRRSSGHWPASRPRSSHHGPARPPAAAPRPRSWSMAQASTWRRVASSASSQPRGGHLPGAGLQPRRGLLGHPQRVPGQRGGGLVLLPGLGQQPGPVGAQRLQHHVPGPAIRAGPRRGQQRAVHQPQHRWPGAVPRDRLGALQGERPREHRHRAEHPPLGVIQQLVTPLHRGRQRPLPLPAASRSPPASSANRSSSRSSSCATPSASTRAAASSIASGIPSSRVTSRATAGPVCSSSAKRASARRARSANSATASAPRRLSRVIRVGQRQRRQPVPGLPGHPQRLPAGRQHPHIIGSRAAARAHSSAAAPITCSQLSSTSSSCCRASTRASASAAGSPGCSRTPSAASDEPLPAAIWHGYRDDGPRVAQPCEHRQGVLEVTVAEFRNGSLRRLRGGGRHVR